VAFLETLLFPLIYLLETALEIFRSLTGNYGAAITSLSMFVAAVSYPLSRYSQRVELREKLLQETMAPKIRDAKRNFKGERQFNEIEKIYQAHNYHPIKSLKSVAGIAFQLPFLIASLLLLMDYRPLAGEHFLFLNDLSKPDAFFLLGGVSVNVLPILMASITVCETAIKPEMTPDGRIKFYFITFGLLLLVYALPSAVVLYWTTNNTISLTRSLVRVRQMSSASRNLD
jgi:YidC/Oxa1 family membrane protein insertase